jgi:hypothetical protein
VGVEELCVLSLVCRSFATNRSGLKLLFDTLKAEHILALPD